MGGCVASRPAQTEAKVNNVDEQDEAEQDKQDEAEENEQSDQQHEAKVTLKQLMSEIGIQSFEGMGARIEFTKEKKSHGGMGARIAFTKDENHDFEKQHFCFKVAAQGLALEWYRMKSKHELQCPGDFVSESYFTDEEETFAEGIVLRIEDGHMIWTMTKGVFRREGKQSDTLLSKDEYMELRNDDPFKLLSPKEFTVDIREFSEVGCRPTSMLISGPLRSPIPPLYVPSKWSSKAELLLQRWDKIHMFFEHVEFTFLDASRVRSFEGNSLPMYQDIRDDSGWFRRRKISVKEVMDRSLQRVCVTISHRWRKHDQPFDSEGKKMKAIREYLNEHLEVEEVWLDWSCLPQELYDEGRSNIVRPRDEKEQELFNATLPMINMLYLGTSVLRIVDESYTERFWTQFEAYLSYQTINKYGFQSDGGERTSTSFVCNASQQLVCKQGLDFLSRASYEQVHDHLSSDTVKVTSARDKTVCLLKLETLVHGMAVICNTVTQ